MKKIWTILLVMTAVVACKKNTTPGPDPVIEAKTELTATIASEKFTLPESAITPNFYIDGGQSSGALGIQANLNSSKSLVIFVDNLQNGEINLTQSYPTQMGVNFDKSTKLTLQQNSSQSQTLASPPTSYIKYVNAANSYFAVSGKITIQLKGKDAIISWNVVFKDAAGTSFSSTGTTTIVDYKKNTKPTSQITNPTSAVTVTSIAPDYAWTGTTVTLTGTGFSAVNAENTIVFGGENLKPIKSSANQLEFMVPIFTNNHKPIIEVKVFGNSSTNTGFTFLPQIHSFTPAKAPVGNTVQIFGLAFPVNASELVVKFDDVVAEVKENNQASVKVVVPQNAKTGKISVSYKGKADVWSSTDFEVATAPTGGANSVPIGRSFATAANVDFTSKNAVVDYFSGEHEVAIYKTPAGKGADIGKGKLVISRSGNIFTMKLIGPSGSTLKEASLDLTNDKDYNYENLTHAGSAYIISARERAATSISVGMTAYDNGFLKGDVFDESTHSYSFRNNVEYFGLTPPPAIAALTGIWKGAHTSTNVCQPNIITTTIAADGTITLNGKDSFDCSLETFVEKWDGQDDFVEPNARGYRGVNVGSTIYLGASRAGGSQGGGSIWITVPQLADATSILEVLGNVGGYNGILFTEFPAKQ